MHDREHNPERYWRLSEPFDSAEVAEEAVRAFQGGVKALREKHGIPDVVVAFSGTYLKDGEAVPFVAGTDWGDAMKAEGLSAWMYGRCKAQREHIVNQLFAQGEQAREPGTSDREKYNG